MFSFNFIAAILIAITPFFIEHSHSTMFRRRVVPVILCIAAAAAYITNSVGSSVCAYDDLLDTRPIECSEESMAALSDKNSEQFRNILILCSDARPDKNIDDSRYDLIYIVQISDESVSIVSLSRDTLVKYAGTSQVGKLNGAGAVTGNGVQGVIDTVQLNFGIRVDEFVVATWKNVVEVIRVIFPNGYRASLSKIEELGINDVLIGQNKNFQRDKYLGLLDIGEEGYKGIDVIDYIKDPMNFIVGVNKNGDPIDKNGDLVNVKEGMNEHIYEINDIIKDTPVERYFSPEEHEVLLDEYQTLAYARVRYCYESQSTQRERNVMTIIVDSGLTALGKLLSPECGTFLQALSENTAIRTSYETIDSALDDVKLVAVNKGVVMPESGRKIYSLPYISQEGELVTSYISLKEQTDRVLYRKE